jgi:hypothetical protein
MASSLHLDLCQGEYMKRSLSITFGILAAFNAYSDTSGTAKVSIQIVGLTLAPSRVDGTIWNAMGHSKVQPSVTAKIAKAMLATSPQGAAVEVVSIVGGLAMTESKKPAPMGWVEVATKGEFQPEFKKKFGNPRLNTLTPIINSVSYKGIPYSQETRLKVTVYDYHAFKKYLEPMGVAEINATDLYEALKAQKVYQVKVADQTQNQVLFVGIEVRKDESQ